MQFEEYQYSLPFLFLFLLHYNTHLFLPSKAKLKALFLIFISSIYTLLYYLKAGLNFSCKIEILSTIPTIYLINSIFLRYLLFNKYSSKWALKNDGNPYDPIIVVNGIFFVRSTSKRRPATIAETIYSFFIFFFPLVYLIIVMNKCP